MRAALALLLALIAASPAMAQKQRQADAVEHVAAAAINPPCLKPFDIRPECGSLPIPGVQQQQGALNLLSKPFQDLADFLSSDSAGAITLSTQIPALQDGHGQQCWMAMSSAGAVFQAHPVPLTFKAMTDIEALRLLQMTANNLCSNVHCTQVFADLTAAAQAASPTPLPIPSLHDLCSKIPQIPVVAPVTPPASTPAPATPPAQ